MPAESGYKEAQAISEAAREQELTLPSFCKELYLGHFRPELISPQPVLPAEAVEKGERFLADLGAFLEEHVDPQAIERDGRVSDDVIAGFKKLGALGMKVPEEHGGLGLSQVYYNRAMMLVGTCHSSLSTLLSAHQSIGAAQPLLLFGSEEQKREWLPKVCTTHLSAFALTEPGVGSDPARVTTTANPDRGRRGLHHQRPQAVDDQRDRGRRGRRDGQGASQRGSQGEANRLHRPQHDRGRGRRASSRVHGAARHRELSDPVHQRLLDVASGAPEGFSLGLPDAHIVTLSASGLCRARAA
jgi:Acyl-CoA dehydrogenase, N-terminal domain